jgi:hypothetical protein
MAPEIELLSYRQAVWLGGFKTVAIYVSRLFLCRKQFEFGALDARKVPTYVLFFTE